MSESNHISIAVADHHDATAIDHHGGACSSISEVSLEWTFLAMDLVLEISMVVLEQYASKRRPLYSLIAVAVSVMAFVICTAELFYKGRNAKVTVQRRGMRCWFHYPSSNVVDTPFYSFVDVFALFCAVSQVVFSVVAYCYYRRHMDNPIKVSVVSIIFILCLAFSKLTKNSSHASLSPPSPTIP